ncbi:MAG: flavodoxin family protein, partial [Candidatus Bipolaricaulis sp.]|nr:flavodoxin family protein [Candidatus Bipolaricaulis sp.]
MSAKILALCGSPRAGSNTQAYLEAALGVLKECGAETELVELRGKTIRSCQACYACWRKGDGVCQIQGDDFRPVFEKMLAADALI